MSNQLDLLTLGDCTCESQRISQVEEKHTTACTYYPYITGVPTPSTFMNLSFEFWRDYTKILACCRRNVLVSIVYKLPYWLDVITSNGWEHLT